MRDTRVALGLSAGLVVATTSIPAAAASKLAVPAVMKWAGALLTASAFAGTAGYIVYEPRHSVDWSPAPVDTARPAAMQAPIAQAPTTESIEVAPPVARAVPPPGAPPVTANNSKKLSAEIASLDAVKRHLVAGDPAAALGALAKFRRDFPAPALGPEAIVLEVHALLSHGDPGHRDRGIALAKRFLKTHPTSPHARQLEEVLSKAHEP
jgi:hypothetical protein